MIKKEVKPADVKLESALLKALSNRVNYETFAQHIDLDRLLPNTALLLTDYGKYFNTFDGADIDWGTFTTEFTQHWHSRDLDNDDIVYYRDTVIPIIEQAETEQVGSVLAGLLDRDYIERITQAISGGIDPGVLIDIVDSYTADRSRYVSDADGEAYSIDRVDFSVLDKSKGIPWCLPSLQKGLGSLVQGQFIVVAASHGTGKSAFVLSQTVEAFKHLQRVDSDRPILYFNSEGTQADVFARFLSGLYSKHVGGGFEEIYERIDEVKEKFTESFDAKNLLVFQIGQGDAAKINQKINKYNPSLVIIDIADVLAKDEDVQSLKKLYDSLRLASGRTCPIIATTQSGDTSYKFFNKEENKMVVKNRKWLTENDLYGSKPGKGGAADTIITIGKDDDIPNVRYIHTPKIKRGQVVKATCELIDKYSSYKEIM